MRTKIFSVVILSIICISTGVSCSSRTSVLVDDVPVIQVDLSAAPMTAEESGRIFTNPSFVILRGAMLGMIEEMVDMGDRYAIYDGKQGKVFLFDTLGQLIRQVGNPGKGPMEYVQLGGIALQEGELVLYSIIPHKLMFFDKNGEYLRTEECSGEMFFSKGIACSRGRMYGVSSCNRGHTGSTVWMISSDPKRSFLPYENWPAAIVNGAFQSVADSGVVWISRPFDNRVYRIGPESDEPKAVFQFDFGKGNLPLGYTDGISGREISMNAQQDKVVFHAGKPCQVGQYMVFFCGCAYVLVDLIHGTAKPLLDIPVCDGVTVTPWGYLPLSYQSQRIVMQMGPFFTQEKIEKGLLPHSPTLDSLMAANAEYQNPILILYDVSASVDSRN